MIFYLYPKILKFFEKLFLGMMSHPPIPIMDLAAHIDDLKVDDNLKFSSEYESIEPGQQFTW